MKPKKILIEIAKQSGAITRMNQLLSAIQILNAQANSLAGECSDILQEYGLNLGRIKQLHNNFIRASDNYFHEFASCIFDEEQKMNMFQDMDSFSDVFYQWSGLQKKWEPNQITINKTETNE